MRVIDRERHQRRRFVAGVAEHQALVAGSLVEIQTLAFVHALCDIGRLPVVAHHHRAAVIIEPQFRVVVADALDGVASHLDIIDIRARGDFASQHHQTGVDQSFSRDAGMGVFAKDRVENGV